VAAKKTGGSLAAADAPASADLMRESVQGLFGALKQRASHNVAGKIESTTKNLVQRAEDASVLPEGAKDLAQGKPLKAMVGAGVSKAKDKVKEAVQGLTGGKGAKGGRGKLKVTNIVEAVDVGVPIDVAYDQWTRFTEFPSFMKKVEHVEQESEEKLTWKAQVFWSHRSWESQIVEQVPDERIVWTSKGEKGRVDGAVTFHELAPSLTRIVIVLAYHPQGLFEHVGNMWRAQGRRARLELKHFQRHVMTDTILHADELEGWRGEIHDGEVQQPGESEPDEHDEDRENDEDRETEEDRGNGGSGKNGKRGERGERRRSGGDDSADGDGAGDSDDGQPEAEDEDEAKRDRKPRRRSDPDDERDEGGSAGKRQRRPARNRGSRTTEKAGAS